MFKKISILILLLLLFLSISVVSANEDVNTTISDNGGENIILSQNNDDLLSNQITVNEVNYNDYFGSDGKASSNINSGDTIKLDGSFSNRNFIFDKKVTVEGTSSNSMADCTIKLLSGASGSIVMNLKITNTKQYAYGVCLDGADECVVKNCDIVTTGQAAYPIAVGNGANHNQIINNHLKTSGASYGHGSRSTTPLVLFGSHYNYVANNVISCGDANGIYLSSYGAGPFKGAESNFNRIFNNTIIYSVIPTSWSYGIQVMGSNNTVESNTVNGAFRGISSSTEYDGGNKFINNRIINLGGIDYSSHETIGGQNAIVATYNSIVSGNIIQNSSISASGSGIIALDGSIVENNQIYIKDLPGNGIHAYGSNIIVRNNIISTTSGAGIFQQSASTGLIVEFNRIISNTGIGILIKKINNRERPSSVKIIKNNITTKARYVIDANDVEKDSDWEIIDNKGGLVLTPNGSYNADRPTYNYNGSVIEITPENYLNYFDENGNIKSNTINELDIVKFKGTFSNKDIIINERIKILGEGAFFKNTTFKIISGGVWIENININNSYSRINNWGILINKVDDGVVVFKNNISVYDLKSAYAIYVVDSAYIDVINNTLFSSGDFLTYTLLSYSVSDCRFINNTITTVGTGEVYSKFEEYCLDGNSVCLDGHETCLDGSCLDGSHIVQEIHRTYGILSLYSSGNEISRNRVNVSSKLNRTFAHVGENLSANTIIGIDLYYNTHANIISDNIVFLKGNDNYMYGMGVLGYYSGMNAPIGEGATLNQFLNNVINIDGNYFVTGIIVGDESEYTTVENNIINAKSNNVSYGITLEMPHKSIIKNNKVTLNSNIVYGAEVFQSYDNEILNNDFLLNGDKIYGIALNANRNNIKSNKIIVNASGRDIDYKEFDSLNGPISGILLVSDSTGNIIDDNNITSNEGYAINIQPMSVNNLISNNYLISPLGNANNAVNASGNNNIVGNYIYLINATLFKAQVQYLESGKLVLNISKDLIDDLEGAKVDFYVDKYIGTAYVKNGTVVLNYALDEGYIPSYYIISAVITQENYKVTEFESELEITKGNLNVEVLNASVKDGLNGKFIVKITNALGKPVSGLYVVFYRGSVPIGSAVTDNNGVATRITLVPKTLNGEYDIKAEVRESDYYLADSGLGKLKILDIAPVSINVNRQVSSNSVFATLVDNNGFAVANKKVSVNIGGTSYSLKTDGEGKLILPNIAIGNHALSITFEGDSVYKSANYNGELIILPPLSENNDFNVYYGSNIQYKVHVRGSDGNFVGEGHEVAINVGGKTYNVKTDKNGYAILDIKLGVGKYTITANYNDYTVSNKITVKPTLSAKNISVKKSKKIKFSAKLVDKNGKVLKKKKITFKIKNKKYYAKTNKKGKATIVIKKLKPGKYTISSSYGGCTIKNTIKIKK